MKILPKHASKSSTRAPPTVPHPPVHHQGTDDVPRQTHAGPHGAPQPSRFRSFARAWTTGNSKQSSRGLAAAASKLQADEPKLYPKRSSKLLRNASFGRRVTNEKQQDKQAQSIAEAAAQVEQEELLFRKHTADVPRSKYDSARFTSPGLSRASSNNTGSQCHDAPASILRTPQPANQHLSPSGSARGSARGSGSISGLLSADKIAARNSSRLVTGSEKEEASEDSGAKEHIEGIVPSSLRTSLARTVKVRKNTLQNSTRLTRRERIDSWNRMVEEEEDLVADISRSQTSSAAEFSFKPCGLDGTTGHTTFVIELGAPDRRRTMSESQTGPKFQHYHSDSIVAPNAALSQQDANSAGVSTPGSNHRVVFSERAKVTSFTIDPESGETKFEEEPAEVVGLHREVRRAIRVANIESPTGDLLI